MIILLDTSTPVCRLVVVFGDTRHSFQWEANRSLAKGLLKFLSDSLTELKMDLKDVAGIGVLLGPGSFTGLRIGITVANTLADNLSTPIVGETGDDWQDKALGRLRDGQNDQIALPHYGSQPHITSPRK